MPNAHKICSACKHDAGEKHPHAKKCPKCGAAALVPAAELAAVRLSPEQAAQLQQVHSWVLDGHDEHHIREAILTEWPDADPPAILAAAVDRIAASSNFDEALILGFCLESTRHLYQKMLAIGDFSGALKAIQQLHKFASTSRPLAAEQE
ncbi:MAG: hypothetical protein RBS99_16285 [Rhodospirillales bacterium]|jgi:hypothetical protein|nr:hypothetical protein [Rhodospirillales bacterium]